ncbi:MAG TPA: cobalamin-binding protein [Verrucomicrobiae bacterium]|jgi:iron complex transport system substrate-binding protein|nr:cobalamin-binding protein [Verrucomicrobiae bacterium]
MKICSLLPSATEILFALGLGDDVAGISHECDFPPEAKSKAVLIKSRITHTESAAAIDRQVGEFLQRGESLYSVDFELLRAIEPDLIVTQDLCHVCAATPDDLGAALAHLERQPRVVTLNPHSLADVCADIHAVGKATGRAEQANRLVAEFESAVADVERSVAGLERPRVLCLEWLDPPYVAGHWVPEMVERAGGVDVLGQPGKPSFRVDWDAALATLPDVVLIMPCGYTLAAAKAEFRNLPLPRGWSDLPAVRDGRVYVVEASGYFSRPGPRLAEGLKILADAIHAGDQARFVRAGGAPLLARVAAAGKNLSAR